MDSRSSGSSSITLNPGMYYINGGGISMSGSSGISGNGVFIYNTGGGAITLSGSGTIALSPMTSGTYQGITIFQDRSSSTAATMSGGCQHPEYRHLLLPGRQTDLERESGVASGGRSDHRQGPGILGNREHFGHLQQLGRQQVVAHFGRVSRTPKRTSRSLPGRSGCSRPARRDCDRLLAFCRHQGASEPCGATE